MLNRVVQVLALPFPPPGADGPKLGSKRTGRNPPCLAVALGRDQAGGRNRLPWQAVGHRSLSTAARPALD